MKKTGLKLNPTTRKAKEIKEQLEWMHDFMDADATLCGMAGMSYDYEKHLEGSYKLIAQRLGVSVEEVRKADD